MVGTVAVLDRTSQCGAIRGADGKVRRFDLVDMIYTLEFQELQLGDEVVYEVDDEGGAINVERD